MKKTCILCLKQQVILVMIFLFFIPISVKAQSDTCEYVPIPDNAIWSVNSLKFKTFGDTIINNKNYLKVYWQEENAPYEFDINKASYFCALRNDTAAKRVYGVYKEATEVVYRYKNGTSYKYNSTDTSEFLLYDFSLKTGDTVWAASFFDDISPYNIIMYQFICTLNSDSSILLNDSSSRKKINMDINIYFGENKQYWIEGIGSTNGFFTPAFPRSGLEIQPRRLLCFVINDELLIKFPEFDYDTIPDDCYSIGDISSLKEYNISSGVRLYPNPATDELTVDNGQIYMKELYIYDVVGKEVKHLKSSNTKITVSVGDLCPGVYMVKVLSEDGIAMKKFVKE